MWYFACKVPPRRTHFRGLGRDPISCWTNFACPAICSYQRSYSLCAHNHGTAAYKVYIIIYLRIRRNHRLLYYWTTASCVKLFSCVKKLLLTARFATNWCFWMKSITKVLQPKYYKALGELKGASDGRYRTESFFLKFLEWLWCVWITLCWTASMSGTYLHYITGM